MFNWLHLGRGREGRGEGGGGLTPTSPGGGGLQPTIFTQGEGEGVFNQPVLYLDVISLLTCGQKEELIGCTYLYRCAARHPGKQSPSNTPLSSPLPSLHYLPPPISLGENFWSVWVFFTFLDFPTHFENNIFCLPPPPQWPRWKILKIFGDTLTWLICFWIKCVLVNNSFRVGPQQWPWQYDILAVLEWDLNSSTVFSQQFDSFRVGHWSKLWHLSSFSLTLQQFDSFCSKIWQSLLKTLTVWQCLVKTMTVLYLLVKTVTVFLEITTVFAQNYNRLTVFAQNHNSMTVQQYDSSQATPYLSKRCSKWIRSLCLPLWTIISFKILTY